jgi:SAM-dependent methyltransferase
MSDGVRLGAQVEATVGWLPSSSESVRCALDLADVRAGDSFVDLGCGDGRVLAAASECGAGVTGIEHDPAMAAEARRQLANAGIEGEVIEGSIFSTPWEADVVFAFLSPAILQRLTPRFLALGEGKRVVTTGSRIPGWQADAVAGGCYLYRLPTRPTPPPVIAGWDTSGVFVALRPDQQTIVSLPIAYPPGPVDVVARGGLEPVTQVVTGVDEVSALTTVAVDVTFAPREAGTAANGTLEAATGLVLRVMALYTSNMVGVRPLDHVLHHLQISPRVHRDVTGGDLDI